MLYCSVMNITANREPLFKNRKLAGKALGLFLTSQFKSQNPIVAGLQGGGAEVAWYVAKELEAPLIIVVSMELPMPANQEYGFGAITEDHSVYIPGEAGIILDEIAINQVIERLKPEVDRLIITYRQGRPLPDLQGRLVILIDEGIVTGMTLVPVIRLCRKKGASKVVVATPVSGEVYDKAVEEADDIKVMVKSDHFLAKGQAYEQSAKTDIQQPAKPEMKG